MSSFKESSALVLSLGAMLAATACGGSDNTNTTMTLYQRLGSDAGITAVINDFLTKVVADPKINGYFLNSAVDGSRLQKCLVKIVNSATGGPAKYPAAGMPADSDGCRDMKTAHHGLKISMNDMNDLVGHLMDALTAKNVSTADKNMIAAALTPLFPDIVEDAASNGTIYQRIGRKAGIEGVIDDFIGKVVADNSINGFFMATAMSPAGAARLKTCLVRQVCAATGGPCIYDMGVEDSLKSGGTIKQCRDMMSVHMSLKSPQGDASGRAITIADFNALVGDLVAAMTAKGVPAAEQMMIGMALAPLCPQIVSGGTGCQ